MSGLAVDTRVPFISAVMVTEYVPAGVPPELVELELLEQPVKSVAIVTNKNTLKLHFKFRLVMRSNKTNTARKPEIQEHPVAIQFFGGEIRLEGIAIPLAVVAIVMPTCPGLLVGDPGNIHAAPMGSPEHAILALWTVVVPRTTTKGGEICPATTVMVLGTGVRLKVEEASDITRSNIADSRASVAGKPDVPANVPSPLPISA